MVKILKYPFDIAEEVTLNMPENSRVFKLYDTGEELDNGSTPKKYCGTLQMDGTVKHIFEK